MKKNDAWLIGAAAAVAVLVWWLVYRQTSGKSITGVASGAPAAGGTPIATGTPAAPAPPAPAAPLGTTPQDPPAGNPAPVPSESTFAGGDHGYMTPEQIRQKLQDDTQVTPL